MKAWRSDTFRRSKHIYRGRRERESESMRVMYYSKAQLPCENNGTLVVVYSFFKPPGETRHKSSLTHRIMFHPDTPEGRVLLDRIKDAFCNGVIDVICWPQLPQRTSPYISRKHHMTACHLALNGMGIPQVSRPNRLVETRTRAADRGNDKPKHAQRDKVSIVVPQLGATTATASFIVDVEASPSPWLALRHGHVESSRTFGA